MTQLIENKRRRRALIATLLHFSNRHSLPIRNGRKSLRTKEGGDFQSSLKCEFAILSFGRGNGDGANRAIGVPRGLPALRTTEETAKAIFLFRSYSKWYSGK